MEGNGQPPRLTKQDVVAIALGVLIDGVVEFVHRVRELQQELNEPAGNPGSERRNG